MALASRLIFSTVNVLPYLSLSLCGRVVPALSPILDWRHLDYVLVRAGQTCSQAGYAYITTRAECEVAAAAIGFTGSFPAQRSGSYVPRIPRGCSVEFPV